MIDLLIGIGIGLVASQIHFVGDVLAVLKGAVEDIIKTIKKLID